MLWIRRTGLVVVLRGMYDALTGKVTDFKIEGVSKAKIAATGKNTGAAIENVDIKIRLLYGIYYYAR